MKKKRIALLFASAVLTLSAAITSYSNTIEPVTVTSAETAQVKAPKYIFLFIGDGMSYPQFQSASDYLGAIADKRPEILKGGKQLSFMNFPVQGNATTYDSTSFCPDSASTATSMATGHKTYSGVINMSEDKTVKYETIAEKLKNQLGYKIGIVSSVNLNHATPAAFYCHQPSRNNYYEISKELIASEFDYFAGGGLKQTTGADKNLTNSYDLAKQAGYNVVNTQAEAEKLTSADGKTILIGETLADSDSLSYQLDTQNTEWELKDYVKKGIEMIDNDKGFFMMVEGGKIDWACHANDAGSTINDTLALGDAVSEAVAFYNQHPDETLILVTGDHETGGLTIGYAGTNYDTYLDNMANQKISYAKYDSEYITKYKENKTSFDQVMTDVENLFGLVTPENAANAKDSTLVLTEYEMSRLKKAYETTLAGGIGENPSQEEYILYGEYEPLSVTVTHILNNKSGINFSSYSHTGLPVAVFAQGQGASQFNGGYDNTDIYNKLAAMLKLK